jgi:hypothetical protein
MKARPLSVTIIAVIYIAVGAVGFTYHFPDFRNRPLRFDTLGVELIRILAIIAGACMLRGQDWARWLAIVWIAFHAVLGAMHSFEQFTLHLALLAVVAVCLLRPTSRRFFRPRA